MESVKGLAVEKERVAVKEKEVVGTLIFALAKMGYRVVPREAATQRASCGAGTAVSKGGLAE